MKRKRSGYYVIRIFHILKITTLIFLLSSCSLFEKPARQAPLPTPKETTHFSEPIISPPISTTQVQVVDKKNSQQKIIECQNALETLSKTNPGIYSREKAAFDALVKNASLYGSVRAQVAEDTRDTVDALYKFKTNKLCSEIERDAMNSLINSANRAAP